MYTFYQADSVHYSKKTSRCHARISSRNIYVWEKRAAGSCANVQNIQPDIMQAGKFQINIWQSTMNQKKSAKLGSTFFICHPSFQEKVSDPAVQLHWSSGARLSSKVSPPTVMQARERGQIRRNTMNHSKTLILQNMSSICRFSSLKKGSWVWSLDSTVRRHSGSLTFMQASNKYILHFCLPKPSCVVWKRLIWFIESAINHSKILKKHP